MKTKSNGVMYVDLSCYLFILFFLKYWALVQTTAVELQASRVGVLQVLSEQSEQWDQKGGDREPGNHFDKAPGFLGGDRRNFLGQPYLLD